MPRFAANLMFMFTELPFEARFKAAAEAGFKDVEYQFPYGKDLDLMRDALAHARELACPRVHVMSGIVAEKDTALAMAVYAENLRFAARTAESAEINVVIEPINGIDVPGYLVQRTEQARALIAMVGEENLNLQYDVYHALMNGEDPIEGLRANFGCEYKPATTTKAGLGWASVYGIG